MTATLDHPHFLDPVPQDTTDSEPIQFPDLFAPDFGARDDLPCRQGDGDLWFSDAPSQLEAAKGLCEQCPVMEQCLRSALARQEPWGVWGGQIFDQGVVIARKRGRGRPRKNAA